MRKMLLAASAAVAALSMPALAQDHGHGGGGGGGGGPPDVSGGPPATIPASPNANDRASGQIPGDIHAQTDSHASDRAQTRTGADVDRSTRTDTDRDHNTRDRNVTSGAGAVVKDRATQKYGGNTCPPGLAGRDPACVPPGQANRSFTVGQHLSKNYRYYTELSGIPQTARSQVPTQYQTNDYTYIYQPDRIYVVDRSTNKVATVVDLNG
jgi:hypothetical protein